MDDTAPGASGDPVRIAALRGAAGQNAGPGAISYGRMAN
jgi:hypothetical protein